MATRLRYHCDAWGSAAIHSTICALSFASEPTAADKPGHAGILACNTSQRGRSMKSVIHLHGIVRIAIAAGIVSVASLAFAQDATEASRQETWRETIAQTPVPEEGCFQAAYPSLAWSKVECVVAPPIPFRPRTGAISQTVGTGMIMPPKSPRE